MSTLATFGASKDHARERAGLLSGGAAVGRLSGLGLARMPEGGTRKKCAETTWSVSGANVVAQYPGMVVLEGNGSVTVRAGPSDVIVKDKTGIVIGRVPGCGNKSFPLQFPYQNPDVGISIENTEGGGGVVFTGYRVLPPFPGVTVTMVDQPGIIQGLFCQGLFCQGIHNTLLYDITVPNPVTEYDLDVFIEYPETNAEYYDGYTGQYIYIPVPGWLFSGIVRVGPDANTQRITVPIPARPSVHPMIILEEYRAPSTMGFFKITVNGTTINLGYDIVNHRRFRYNTFRYSHFLASYIRKRSNGTWGPEEYATCKIGSYEFYNFPNFDWPIVPDGAPIPETVDIWADIDPWYLNNGWTTTIKFTSITGYLSRAVNSYWIPEAFPVDNTEFTTNQGIVRSLQIQKLRYP